MLQAPQTLVDFAAKRSTDGKKIIPRTAAQLLAENQI
jgi:hypothetical protein